MDMILFCDIDGTLCFRHNNFRRPTTDHEWYMLFAKAHPRIEVIAELQRQQKLCDHTVIFTGRRESNRLVTERWLARNGLPQRWLWKSGIRYDELLMRSDEDTRSNVLVKIDMYLRALERYPGHCPIVIDDDSAVLRELRRLGVNQTINAQQIWDGYQQADD
jgi:hypothetical protein